MMRSDTLHRVTEWVSESAENLAAFREAFISPDESDDPIWLGVSEDIGCERLQSGDLCFLPTAIVSELWRYGESDVVDSWFAKHVRDPEAVILSVTDAQSILDDAQGYLDERREAARAAIDDRRKFLEFCAEHDMRKDSRAAAALFNSDQEDQDWAEYYRVAEITSTRHERTDYDALLDAGYDRDTAREMIRE